MDVNFSCHNTRTVPYGTKALSYLEFLLESNPLKQYKFFAKRLINVHQIVVYVSSANIFIVNLGFVNID